MGEGRKTARSPKVEDGGVGRAAKRRADKLRRGFLKQIQNIIGSQCRSRGTGIMMMGLRMGNETGFVYNPLGKKDTEVHRNYGHSHILPYL